MSGSPTITARAEEYLAYRRQLGFELTTVASLLLRFAQYADQSGHQGPLTTELAIRWAALAPSAAGSCRAYRLTVVRGFARYCLLFDDRTEIPPQNVFGPPYRRRIPYIYSPEELATLLKAAANLPPAGSLRPRTYSTFIGLLACTGLRNREARRLTRGDVDFERRLLHISETKFRKSRLVPLHASTVQALQEYARLRDLAYPISRTDAFFVSMRGTCLAAPTVHCAFHDIRQQLEWRRTGDRPWPRLHDLRHTFACQRLLDWYRQGVDLHHAIAALATYLGHADIDNTYWYLTATPELMELAGTRFERFASFTTGDAT